MLSLKKAPAAPSRALARLYATRIPERPRMRIHDPLESPSATWTDLPDAATSFVHRPPPSTPSPHSYTTAPSSALLRPPTAAPPSAVPAPPPLLKRADEARPRVSDEDVARIRTLRREDPATWTRGRLAKEFDCDPAREGARGAPGQVGERRTMARELRQKRKEFW
ncbi:uncharacterized protein BXZ73DRAFT_89856 [Epithele typhae]|uniref:uncharacterized protein n=1 Tax=Epithele typhae TaxID=378194 RepID=UPI002008C56B|nr:uncharacterized protein BXZ73DRAFT_89856 [Epithele typhae]KAH9933242.1 hypothetical protein BXZ73DRAFT_89856 [Epithele typhae]